MTLIKRPFTDFLEEVVDLNTSFWDSSATPLFTRKYGLTLNPTTLVTDLATQLFGGDENYATAFILRLPGDAGSFFKVKGNACYHVSIIVHQKYVDHFFKFKHTEGKTRCTLFVGYIHFTRSESIDDKVVVRHLVNWKPWNNDELPPQIPVWIQYRKWTTTQISDDYIDHLYSQKVCSIVNKNERLQLFDEFKVAEVKPEPVKSTPPKATFNILLLGQTGVGKSTFINALANYLTYESFDEALYAQPICLIPTNFSIMNDEFEAINIKIGDSPNERQDRAHSFTLDPKVYRFEGPEQTINIIDVPGSGTTEGLDNDDDNKMKIMAMLKLFKEIHGIFILLKAGDNKLTAEYKYCMSELLMNLHRSTVDNMFFVFTNSRGFDYRTGNAHEPLGAYLQELKANKGIDVSMNKETVYCLDNDGYRFQCAYFQNCAFRYEDPSNYEQSWNKSRDQVKRMLARMSTLTAHVVSDTLTVNEARTVAMMLLDPLASITKLINDLESSQRQVLTQLPASEKFLDVDLIDHAITGRGFKSVLSDLNYEQEVITKTLVDFGVFLRAHSFLQFNDEFEHRLKQQIREKEAVTKTDNRKVIKQMQQTLEEFLRKKAAFENVLDAGERNGSAFSSDKISDFRDALFFLPLHGEKFQEIYNKLTKASRKRYSEKEFVIRKVGITL